MISLTAVLTIFAILLLALIGVPLFAILTLAALSAFSFAGTSLSAVATEVYRVASWPTLVTIPLFTFAGHLMAESQSPARLLKLAKTSLGHIPGGVAIISLMICAFFTAFTGASGVTIIALGGLLYPLLKNEGYSENFSLGLVTTSGSLGLLFPPSLPIILYGIVAKIDIDKLFLAGIVPGILLILILSLWSLKHDLRPKRRATKFSLQEFMLSFKGCLLEFLLPFGVLLGIYGGFTTVTEIAALTAFYILIIECFIYKDLNFFQDVPKILLESMSLVGPILLILCCAMGFTNYLVDEEIPNLLFTKMKEFITSKYSFLLFLNIFLLLIGAMMDIFSAIIVVVPILLPIAEEFDVNPIHLAIIFLTNLEIGFITPPVGINLFISSLKFSTPVTRLYRATLPYVFLLFIALMIITYVPALSLFWFR